MNNKYDPARKSRIDDLITAMKQAPKAFFESGKCDDLLKEFYFYSDRACLIPLLQTDDVYIKRMAIWLISELADDAAELVEHIIPLIENSDRATAYYAYESLTSISDVDHDVARYIVSAIHHEDHVISVLGMYLLSNMSDRNLAVARAHFESHGEQEQKAGLDVLLDGAETFGSKRIRMALSSMDSLQARFLCAALRRNKTVIENRLFQQISEHPDKSVRLFVRRYLATSEPA